MRYLPYKQFVAQFLAVTALSAAVCVAALAQTSPYSGVGKPASQEDIGVYGLASGPSGKDLPPGKGTAKQGTQIFLVKCSMCHGTNAEGHMGTPGAFSPLAGLRLGGGNGGPLYKTPPDRIVTLATYAAWSTAIFNTIIVEMPYYRAGTITPDEAYALTAYILFKNGIIKEDDVMDRGTLPKVQMPNHQAFTRSADTTDEILDMQKRGCVKPYGVCR